MRSIEACGNNEWTLATWNRNSGENPQIRPFRCHSWRHEGECQRWCGAIDFVRIAAALQAHRNWTYCVLTYPHRDYANVDDLFRAGKDQWNLLRKRLNRQYGKFLYIQTWEVHKDLYPHVNVTISNQKLYREAVEWGRHENPKWLQSHAIPSGFGKQCWAEPIRNSERMAGYLVKLGLELTGQAVKNQTPINAPRHFRRIRTSKGLLPKREKNPDITGQLFRLGYDKLFEQMCSPNPHPGGFELEENPGEILQE